MAAKLRKLIQNIAKKKKKISFCWHNSEQKQKKTCFSSNSNVYLKKSLYFCNGL